MAEDGSNSSDEGIYFHGLDLTFVSNNSLAYVAIFFCIASCVVSFVDLHAHLSRMDYPKLQVLEMRILLMIPIYAIFTALSLMFGSWRFFFNTIRDTYESFVLYIFFMLMIAYCGGEGQLLLSLRRKRYKGMHPFPMCWLPTFTLDRDFYLRSKRWVLQCALIKPVCSFIAMVTVPLGIYEEGHFQVDNVYTYTCIIINISLTMALYYLVLFEVECEKELRYAKTFLKFLCIKSIIFFSYWQSVAVSLAASAGLLYLGKDSLEKEKTSSVIQEILISFELLPVAFLHHAAFSRSKLDEEMASVPVYMKDTNSGNFRTNVDTALSVNDIVHDTIGTIFYRRGKLVDLENNDDTSDSDAGNGRELNGRDDRPKGGGALVGAGVDPRSVGMVAGDAANLARDPTLEELVRHAVMTDQGVRVDGVLHYDEDSDREARNEELHFTDTNVILHRSRSDRARSDARVDLDLLRSNQAQQQNVGPPQIYCVVCGRFDREMVRRRNGYKCLECVGTKSQSLLRQRQREAAMGSPSDEGWKKGGAASLGAASTHPATDVIIETNDHDLYVRPLAPGRGGGGQDVPFLL
ncbi:unnamed protein product [Phytomonas sp. EM1]|nr:unnamed protein product [Phytomonas sp. EM1]|eukprot:CCW63523.1 unnamed protein product [Phytomonas sp. isolate EM1]